MLTESDLSAIRRVIREELALALSSSERKKATRLPESWVLKKDWGDWAMNEQPSWTPDYVRTQAATFRDYWCSKGSNATKTDWEGTWRNWVRKAGPMLVQAKESGKKVEAGPWMESRQGIEAKGVELGLGKWDEAASQLGRGEQWPTYRARVMRAAGQDSPVLELVGHSLKRIA